MNSFGAALLTLGTGLVMVGAMGFESRAAPETPSTHAPPATGFGALDYFQSNCAKCHGDYGSFYGATFGKNLNDVQMRDVVHDMTVGPAQAPLETRELEVLVAWHRALRDQKPFVALVKIEPHGKSWMLEGEISPGATLRLDGATVEVKGHRWSATTAGRTPRQLEALLGNATSILAVGQAGHAP